jgi:hypothetical protein
MLAIDQEKNECEMTKNIKALFTQEVVVDFRNFIIESMLAEEALKTPLSSQEEEEIRTSWWLYMEETESYSKAFTYIIEKYKMTENPTHRFSLIDTDNQLFRDEFGTLLIDYELVELVG